MIIGGARLYEQMLPHVDCLYLTDIELVTSGDAHFPDYNKYQWHRSDCVEHQSTSGIKFSTYTLNRC